MQKPLLVIHFSLCILLGTSTLTTPTIAAECPSYWTRFRSHCYRFFGVRKPWAQAEAHCSEFGSNTHSSDETISHLVSISSQAENDFIYNFWISTRESTGDDALVWLGFYKPLGRNYFTWVDDSDIDYTYWDIGQPDDDGGKGDCVEMWEGNEHHRLKSWNDRPCDSEASYICKMQYQ